MSDKKLITMFKNKSQSLLGECFSNNRRQNCHVLRRLNMLHATRICTCHIGWICQLAPAIYHHLAPAGQRYKMSTVAAFTASYVKQIISVITDNKSLTNKHSCGLRCGIFHNSEIFLAGDRKTYFSR